MSGTPLVFNFVTTAGSQARTAVITTAIIAGWTGRDRAAM